MKKIKLIFLMSILIFLITPRVYAFSIDGDYEVTEQLPEDLLKWNSLSEEEKANSVMPNFYNVTSIKRKQNSNFLKELKLSASPNSSYRLNDYINLKVKDQTGTSECWAMALSSCLESHISKTTGKTSNYYSSRHMNYATSSKYSEFNRTPENGGNSYIGLSYYVSGKGPVLESDFPFQHNSSELTASEEEKLYNVNVQKQIRDYIQFPTINKEILSTGIVYKIGDKVVSKSKVDSIRAEIKEHIKKYGGITAYSFQDSNYPNYYNSTNLKKATALYCDNNNMSPNHTVLIVGWDDNYSLNNFNPECRPKNNGAYICLTSYGENNYDNGYFYVSYDDVMIERALFGIEKVSDVKYDNLYQYDELGATAFYSSVDNMGFGANVFSRKDVDSEYLTEVGVYLMNYSRVQIYVNTNGNLIDISKMIKATNVSGILSPGYHVIKLDSKIKLNGEKFTVVVKYCSEDEEQIAKVPIEYPFQDFGWKYAQGEKGESYFSDDGENWKNLRKDDTYINVCIKAYTINNSKLDYIINDDIILGILPDTNFNIFDNNLIGLECGNINNTSVKTGDNIVVKDSNGVEKNYILVVRGDVDGDGKSQIVDVSSAIDRIIGIGKLNYVQEKAVDATMDGNIDINDISMMIDILLETDN